VTALTAFELGGIMGSVLVVAVLLVWMRSLRRKGSRSWWIPLALAIVLGTAYTIQAVARLGDAPASNPSAATPATTLELDASSAFRANGYGFARLAPDEEERIRSTYAAATFVREVEVRVATRAQAQQARVIVLATDPLEAAKGNALLNFAAGFADSLSAPRETRDSGGQTIYVVTPTQGTNAGVQFQIWQRENLFVIVFDAHDDQIGPLVDAMIRAG
jgi:hypothetical protein